MQHKKNGLEGLLQGRNEILSCTLVNKISLNVILLNTLVWPLTSIVPKFFAKQFISILIKAHQQIVYLLLTNVGFKRCDLILFL